MLVVVDETLFVSFNRDVGTDVEKGFSENHLFKVYVLMKSLVWRGVIYGSLLKRSDFYHIGVCSTKSNKKIPY